MPASVSQLFFNRVIIALLFGGFVIKASARSMATVCRRGIRSRMVEATLREQGFEVYNGGAWQFFSRGSDRSGFGLPSDLWGLLLKYLFRFVMISY